MLKSFFFFWCRPFSKALLNLLLFCGFFFICLLLFYVFFFFFFFFCHKTCGILATWPRIEPASPSLEGKVPTTKLPGKCLSWILNLERLKFPWVWLGVLQCRVVVWPARMLKCIFCSSFSNRINFLQMKILQYPILSLGFLFSSIKQYFTKRHTKFLARCYTNLRVREAPDDWRAL